MNISLRICSDVLVDVLHSGKRIELVELELIGRRLYYLINGNFKETPLLIMRMATYHKQATPVIVNGATGGEALFLSLDDLRTIPQYVRFGKVFIGTNKRDTYIWEFMPVIFHRMQAKMSGSIFRFLANPISPEPDLLDKLSQIVAQFPKIFYSYREYIIGLNFDEKNGARNVIASLLKLLNRCSNLKITRNYNNHPTILPAEAIADWLFYRFDEKLVSRQGERLLEIVTGIIENVPEIIGHLKKRLDPDRFETESASNASQVDWWARESHGCCIGEETIVNEKTGDVLFFRTWKRYSVKISLKKTK